MKILFDQGTPVPLRAVLAGHTIETAYERGWSTLSNGALLAAAEAASFDVLVTTDQHMSEHSRAVLRHMAVLVLPTTDWRQIRTHAATVIDVLTQIAPGEWRRVNW